MTLLQLFINFEKCESSIILTRSYSVHMLSLYKTGLFPSLDQLELLRLILDFQINDVIIQEFWNDYFLREWGQQNHDDYENHIDESKNRNSGKMELGFTTGEEGL